MFLLAALAAPVFVTPDPLTITLAANSPEITTAPSANIEVQRRHSYHERVTVQRSQNRSRWLMAVATAPTVYPEITTRTRHTFVQNVRLVSSQRIKAEQFLVATGVQDANAIYPPSLTINFVPLAPTIQTFDLIPCALSDDGKWEPPGVFTQKWNAIPLFMEVGEQYVSPPALAITFTPLAPTITASSNALVSPSTPSIQFTAYAPTMVIDGAPILTPAPLTITFRPYAPTITAIEDAPVPVLTGKIGGDDVPRRQYLRYPGWDKKRHTLKLKREQELEQEIRDIYRALTEEPKTAKAAEAIVAPVVAPLEIAAPDAPPKPRPSVDEQARELVARADEGEVEAVDAEIALRMLYNDWRRAQDEDDNAAIELLLKHLL